MHSLTAIIVTHNSAEVLGACLCSLGHAPKMAHPEGLDPDRKGGDIRCSEPHFEGRISTIVVDNASTDHTCEIACNFASVQVIANGANRGFAAAVNQAVCASDADAFLLLNPDAELLPGAITGLANLTHNLAGGRLLDSNGRDQVGFGIRRFPSPITLIFETLGVNRLWRSNPVNVRYRYLDRDLHKSGTVDQPAGAFLYFRREVWERVGGFDEEFHPIWFEDVDFCLRAYQMGFLAVYEPKLLAQHAGGHSIRPLPPSRRISYWYASLLRYASKHFRPVSFRGVCVAVVLGALPRLILDTLRQRSLEPVGAHSKIIRLAVLSLFSPALARPALALDGTGRIRG